MKIIENGKINETLNFKPTTETKINYILEKYKVFVFVLVHWCPYCINFEPTLINFLEQIKYKTKKYVIILDGDKIKNETYPVLSGYSGFPGLLYLENGKIKDRFQQEERTITNLLNLFKKKNIIKTTIGGKSKKKIKKKTKCKKKIKKQETKRRKLFGLF